MTLEILSPIVKNLLTTGRRQTIQSLYEILHKERKYNVTRAEIKKIVRDLYKEHNGSVLDVRAIKCTLRDVTATIRAKEAAAAAAAAAAKAALRIAESKKVLEHIAMLKLAYPGKTSVKFLCKMLEKAKFSHMTRTYITQLVKSNRSE